MSICKLCKKVFEDYQSKGRTRCGSCNTKIRRYRAKAAAVKYLGGKCKICGWQGNQAAFQFHHKNPKEKDFIIGNVANKKWDCIKKEMMKCVLLCSNCHAIEHSVNDDPAFLKDVSEYKGRTLEF